MSLHCRYGLRRMLRDNAVHRELYDFGETTESRRRVIAHYRMGQRVAQTIRDKLQEKGASLMDAGAREFLSGNIDIQNENGKFGKIIYTLNPLCAALLLEDDEAARHFNESCFDIVGASIISCDMNNLWEQNIYSMGQSDFWVYFFYRSWIGESSGVYCELLESRYQKADQQKQIYIFDTMVNCINSFKPYDIKNKVAERFMRECPSIYNYMITRCKQSCGYIVLDNLPSDMLGKILCDTKGKADKHDFIMEGYIMSLYRETMRRSTAAYKNATPERKIITTFFKNVWKDDRVTQAVESIYEHEYTDGIEIQKVKFNRFSDSLQMMRGLTDESYYLKLLLNIWKQERGAGEKNYIRFIRELLRKLDDGDGKLKQIYTDEVFPSMEINLEQFMFFKNEISPKNVMDIDIKYLKDMNVPGLHTDNYLHDHDFFASLQIEYNRMDEHLRIVWEKAHFIIKRKNNLYAYQKKIISGCVEDDIILAKKCGLLPAKVMKSAIEYARKNNCIKALPILIWFESKEAGNGA